MDDLGCQNDQVQSLYEVYPYSLFVGIGTDGLTARGFFEGLEFLGLKRITMIAQPSTAIEI